MRIASRSVGSSLTSPRSLRSAASLRRSAALALLSLPVAAALAACADRAPSIPSVTAAEHKAAWDAWRATRTAWLKIPGRPVSYTGLRWISEGNNTIGSDTSNRVVLPGRDVPPLAGILVRSGDRVRFLPASPEVAARTRIDSAALGDGWLRNDGDSRGASRFELGTAGLRIVKRVDSIGVRTWDSDLAAAERIEPLRYFALDSTWRVAGRLTAAAKPETLAVPTTAGVGEVHIVLGTVAFTLAGKPRQLTAFAGNNAQDLYFTFSDETSGEETYGFRFLHAALDTVSKSVVMDFNFAYNPDCAFSSFTTCPLPPQENRLPVRITAGEQTAVHIKGAPGPKPVARK